MENICIHVNKSRKRKPTVIVDWYHWTGTAHANINLAMIDAWVNEHELGRRTSYDHWELNNNSAVTMFLLKWSA